MKRLTLFSLVVLIYSAVGAPGEEIKGVVFLEASNCPISGLTVEVDPTKDSKQPTVLTATASDGSFTARVIGGRYLLVLYQQHTKVYQSVVQVQVKGSTYKLIALAPVGGSSAAACATAVLHVRPTGGWQPDFLSLDTDGSFLVLDDSHKKVYRLSWGDSSLRSEELFKLPAEVEPVTMASNDQHIYLTSNSNVGCVLYSYSKATLSPFRQNLHQGKCSGLGVDGQKVYVAFGGEDTVRAWNENNFKTPTNSIYLALNESAPNEFPAVAMAVDNNTHEVFLGTQRGRLYVVAPGRKPRHLADVGGAISSIGLGTETLLAVAGGTVRCYTRGVDMVMKKPTAQCINGHLGGQYTGLVVDTSRNAWLIDRFHEDFSGPFPLR